MSIEAMKEALDTLEKAYVLQEIDDIIPKDAPIKQTVNRLRQAIEQAEKHESVAVHQYRVPLCSDWYDGIPDHHDGHGPYEVRTLYTTPQPQREWVALTDDEIWEMPIPSKITGTLFYVRRIEAKIKEKNQ